jgi:hypothetical protein
VSVERDPHWGASVAWLAEVVRSVANDGTLGDRITVPEGVPLDAIARAADFHGVPGFARLALDASPPELTTLVHVAQARHLRALDDLRLVVDVLSEAGVDLLVVKGPALVATCYGVPHLRSYVDLDIAVRPADLGRAVEALERAGCILLDANWPLLSKANVTELFIQAPSGGAIDLHWGLGSGIGRAAPVDLLMSRAVELEESGTRYRTLAPWDFVVQVAVHAALSGGHRLVWLSDLRGALAHAQGSGAPGALGSVVTEWRALPALALMVRRAHHTVGMPIPAGLPRTSRFGPWPAFVALADAAAPPQLVGQGSAVSRLLARSCRATQITSLAAAAAKTGGWIRTGGSTRHGTDVLLNPDDPRSGFYPAGGSAGRSAFFAKVAQEG